MIVDPQLNEEYSHEESNLSEENGQVLVAYLPVLKQVSSLNHVGCLSSKVLNQVNFNFFHNFSLIKYSLKFFFETVDETLH